MQKEKSPENALLNSITILLSPKLWRFKIEANKKGQNTNKFEYLLQVNEEIEGELNEACFYNGPFNVVLSRKIKKENADLIQIRFLCDSNVLKYYRYMEKRGDFSETYEKLENLISFGHYLASIRLALFPLFPKRWPPPPVWYRRIIYSLEKLRAKKRTNDEWTDADEFYRNLVSGKLVKSHLQGDLRITQRGGICKEYKKFESNLKTFFPEGGTIYENYFRGAHYIFSAISVLFNIDKRSFFQIILPPSDQMCTIQVESGPKVKKGTCITVPCCVSSVVIKYLRNKFLFDKSRGRFGLLRLFDSGILPGVDFIFDRELVWKSL
ncbi:MAG: hypothetical protein ACTSVW_06855 [Candidatus Njordarchaeales archaeon]